jgi:two-component sensor histidine kinase/predicted transcriptional regulator
MPKRDDHDEYLKTILDLFKQEPRGLSISDITRAIGLNRNSVSKYVNMLSISGRIEMKTVGPAKVYYLSERVPVSALIDFSTDLIVLLDEKLRIVSAHDHYLALAGSRKDQVIGTKIQEAKYPILSNDMFLSRIPRYGEGEQQIDDMVLLTGEEKRHFRIRILPAAFEGGDSGYAVIIEETTGRRLSEEKMASALHEKEALLRELQLRVRNNLQLITSIINLQMMECRDDAVSPALMETQNRIISLSLAYDLVYAHGMIGDVDMEEYLVHLASELRRSYDLPDGDVIYLPADSKVTLDIDTAIQIGLITNELATIVIDAAARKGDPVKCIVSLSKQDGCHSLRVISDIGVHTIEGLGITLVRTLVHQELKGKFTILPDGWEVIFP